MVSSRANGMCTSAKASPGARFATAGTAAAELDFEEVVPRRRTPVLLTDGAVGITGRASRRGILATAWNGIKDP